MKTLLQHIPNSFNKFLQILKFNQHAIKKLSTQK